MKEMRKLSDTSAAPGPSPKPGSGEARRDRARPPFRSRLFAILLLFALVPTVVVTLIFAVTASRALTLFSADTAWERVARSGEAAFSAMRSMEMTDSQRRAIEQHENELRSSVELAKRFGYVAPRTMRLIALGGLFIVVVVAVGASRVAGHLSRQLSRPLDELVGWTGIIRMGEPLPSPNAGRGAPEFDVLRSGMRTMATELESGRRKALEAERAEAFRESARRFAHELKNPLTPIRFAVSRLRRDVPDSLRETVDVLAEESARLESMARSFAQFGRLPEGPAAEVDVGDLVSRTARSTVPDSITLELDVPDDLPLVVGFHEPLVRAVSNILVNAVEACGNTGRISVRVTREGSDSREARIAVAVQDSGPGIPAAMLEHIFDPYVTTKAGGTGLGLAIARQTVEAHGGSISATASPAGTQVRLTLPLQQHHGRLS